MKTRPEASAYARAMGAILLGSLVFLITGISHASEESANKELDRLSEALLRNKAENYAFRVGFLRPQEVKSFDVQLEKGKQYYFIVGGCSDAFDLNIGVGDERGMIETDKGHDRLARVDITAPETKRYHVLVEMSESVADGAHYSLLFGRPPAGPQIAPPLNVAPTPVVPRSTPPPPQPPSTIPPAAVPPTLPTQPVAGPSVPSVTARIDLNMKVHREDGTLVTLQSLMGNSKAMYIRIWASWCSPCIRLIPTMKARETSSRNANIAFASINSELGGGGIAGGSLEKAREIKRRHQIQSPIYIETQQGDLTRALKVDYVPRTVVIAASGEILFNGHPLDPPLTAVMKSLGAHDFDIQAGL